MRSFIWIPIGCMAALLVFGCSVSAVWTGPADPEPSWRPPSKSSAVGRERFLGHLAIKGMHNKKRNLMTSIVVHPKLWEKTPYLLFDENGFGEAYDRTSPMKIDLRTIRAEARHDAETAAAFWGGRPVHVMVNTEGWPLQWDAAWKGPRAGVDRRAYNARSQAVYLAIQEGIERGWPAIDRFGWWSRIITPSVLERRETSRGVDELNAEAARVWRRASYFAGHIYPFTKLVPDDRTPGEDEAHADEWTRPVFQSVEAMIHLRETLGGDQLVLPCMFGTSRGWRGKYKNLWMTERERRLLVRASYEAGADGIMVWQPIRNEGERDEFQRAVQQIEAELALINGVSDLGPSMTLGEMFQIQRDWPGRPMNWMRRLGDQTLQPAPALPKAR